MVLSVKYHSVKKPIMRVRQEPEVMYSKCWFYPTNSPNCCLSHSHKLHLRDALREFLQIWDKCSLGHKDELIRF